MWSLRLRFDPPLSFVTGWIMCTGQSLNNSSWKYNLKMDACFMTYTPPSVIQGLLGVGFNADEDNTETLAKPIGANATPYREEQCKS